MSPKGTWPQVFQDYCYLTIFGLLDERARPMIPTAMMTAKATLPTFSGGSNGGANVASDNAFSCCIFRT